MSDTASTPPRTRELVRQSWAERLARFESSGLPVFDFCRAEVIASQSLYYWKRTLATLIGAPGPAPLFLPVLSGPLFGGGDLPAPAPES